MRPASSRPACRRPACRPPAARTSAGAGPPPADATAVLHALSDPTRVAILRRIAAGAGPLCVCDIVAAFDLAQPTISYHLGVLRRAGLVTATRRGTWAWYEVVPAGLDPARDLLDSLAAGRRRRRRRME